MIPIFCKIYSRINALISVIFNVKIWWYHIIKLAWLNSIYLIHVLLLTANSIQTQTHTPYLSTVARYRQSRTHTLRASPRRSFAIENHLFRVCRVCAPVRSRHRILLNMRTNRAPFHRSAKRHAIAEWCPACAMRSSIRAPKSSHSISAKAFSVRIDWKARVLRRIRFSRLPPRSRPPQ